MANIYSSSIWDGHVAFIFKFVKMANYIDWFFKKNVKLILSSWDKCHLMIYYPFYKFLGLVCWNLADDPHNHATLVSCCLCNKLPWMQWLETIPINFLIVLEIRHGRGGFSAMCSRWQLSFFWAGSFWVWAVFWNFPASCRCFLFLKHTALLSALSILLPSPLALTLSASLL